MMKIPGIFLVLGITFMSVSCTTGSDRNRGSLSDAMDKSRDDYKEERVVPDEEDDSWFFDDQDGRESPPEAPDSSEGGEVEQAGEAKSALSEEPLELFLLFRGGSSLTGGLHFENPLDLEILLGTSRDTLLGYYLFGGLKTLRVRRDDSLYESIKSRPFILQGGLELRYYPVKTWIYFLPYLTGSMSGFVMFWNYQNALTAGSDTFKSDSLSGLGLDLGVGIDLIQTDTFQAGIQLLPQAFLFGEETSQGFNNDIFNTYGNIRITAEAGMIF